MMNAKKIKTKILQNKYLFYLVSFLAFANLIQFCFAEDLMAAILLIATGLVSSFLIKNNTMSILIAICVANIFSCGRREGFFFGKKKKSSGDGSAADGSGGEETTGDESEEEKFNEAKAIRDEKREVEANLRQEKRDADAALRVEKRDAEEKLREEQREAQREQQQQSDPDNAMFI